jgi:transcription antitermination protein NusB
MITNRHEARLLAVQFLFQRDFNSDEFDRSIEEFWVLRKPRKRVREFATELILGVEEHRKEIDARLQGYAEHWGLDRMGAVDRNILRVGLYEMLYRADIPPVVSIDEAVDLAKEFNGVDSGRFVNGILDRARHDIPRPARTPGRIDAPRDASTEKEEEEWSPGSRH